MTLSPDLALGYHLLSMKNEPQEILPGLFLGTYHATSMINEEGSARCAAEMERLKSEIGITHILSVGGPTSHPDEFITKQLFDIDDLPSFNIFPFFEECVSFIDDARKNGKILVHCHHGVSRSATIVIAYVMYHKKMSVKDAQHHVWTIRPVIKPNDGFIKQLEKYEMKLSCPPNQSLFTLSKKKPATSQTSQPT